MVSVCFIVLKIVLLTGLEMVCQVSEPVNASETVTKSGGIDAATPLTEIHSNCGGSSADLHATHIMESGAVNDLEQWEAMLTLIASIDKEDAIVPMQTEPEKHATATRLPRFASKVHQTSSDTKINPVSAGPHKTRTPMEHSQPTLTAVETVKPCFEDRAEIAKPEVTTIKASSKLPKPSVNAVGANKFSNESTTKSGEQTGVTNINAPNKTPNANVPKAHKRFSELTTKAEEQAAVANIKAPSKLPRPGTNAANIKLSNSEAVKAQEQAGATNDKAKTKIPKLGAYEARIVKPSVEMTLKAEEQPNFDGTKSSIEVPKPVLISPKLRKASTEKAIEIENKTEVGKSQTLSRIPKFRASSAKVKTSIGGSTEVKEELETLSPQSARPSFPQRLKIRTRMELETFKKSWT